MEKYIAAVDLGTKRIALLVGEKTASGKIHVIAHHEAPSEGIEQGEVRNNIKVSDILKSLVSAVKLQHGIDIAEVYAGVSGKHIRCLKENAKIMRGNAAVEISEQEISQLERDMYNIHVPSGKTVLNVIPQIYHLDDGYSETHPAGVLSHRLEAEFCVLVGAHSSMELIQRTVQRAGLQLKGLFLSPLAAAEAVLYDDDKNMGAAVVDIGGGTTDVVIYCEDVVRHVAVIPFGGDVISKDICQGCAIPARYAEQLKVQYGSCYSDLAKENPTFKILGNGGSEVSFRTLAKIIEARVAEIVEAVEYVIQQSGYADCLNAGIVLTGGSAKLGNLTEFIKYKTGRKARLGEPLCVTSDSDSEVKHGRYATAAGLLMKGAAGNGYIIPEKEPVMVEQGLFGNLEPMEVVKAHPPKPPHKKKKKDEEKEKKGIFAALPSLFATATTAATTMAKGFFTADDST
jgi:cell division protein FtsA